MLGDLTSMGKKGTRENMGGSSDLPRSLTLTDHFHEDFYSTPPISEAGLLGSLPSQTLGRKLLDDLPLIQR